MKVHISSLIAPVWNLLFQGISIYERVAIVDDMLSSTAQDSDGESLGFESLVQHLLEFIHYIVERRSSRNLVKGHLSQLFFVCLKYMQMTQDQVTLLSLTFRKRSGKVIPTNTSRAKTKSINTLFVCLPMELLE